jgi:hypothetical protein
LTAENNIFQFYSKRPVSLVPVEQFNTFIPNGPSIFYVDQRAMDQLIQAHAEFKIVRMFVDYPREAILPAFINKDTRIKTLGRVYLITK